MSYFLVICIWFMIIMDISTCFSINNFRKVFDSDVSYCKSEIDLLYKDLQKCKREIKKLKNKVGE